jgi:hypothetical protein
MGQTGQPENYTDFVRRRVQALVKDNTLFEMECPMYTSLQKNSKKYPVTVKGFQIPFFDSIPGQVIGYTAQNTSFGDYVAAQSTSMYVFPIYMGMPMIFPGPTMDMFESGGEEKVTSFDQIIQNHVTAFKKRLEQTVPGDGSGSVAYSATTISTLGTGQTFTGTTAAATTPGQTKGARWLRKNHFYQAIIPTTGAVRGTFKVEAVGTTTATINLIQGSITTNDPIVEPGCYLKMPRGWGHLIGKTSRTLQGLATASNIDLNSPEIDLAGATCTPADFDAAKTALQMRQNDSGAENQLLCHCTYNFYSILKRQGWNLAIQSLEVTKGIAKKYADGDTIFVTSTEMDEDRAYLFNSSAVPVFETKPLDTLDRDGQTWRMLFGDNGTGSDSWQRALYTAYNVGVVAPKNTVLIKRAATAGTQTEVLSY